MATAVKLGEGYVLIGIKNRIEQGSRGVQADLNKIGDKYMNLGKIAGAAGLLIAAPFAATSLKLASFDDQMRAVGAVSKSSEVELRMLTNTAKDLGRTTSFTAVEVASLMAELGRAGFKPDQVNEMTAAVLDLARATGTDATLAAGIMSASIRQFGLDASHAASVADALTTVANGSFNTVEQLGQALEFAGPVAADFNLSIEDTLAILGGLGNVGIQASNAGTALRRLLTITGAEAEKLNGIFGVSFTDSANNARPLVDVLGEVNAATRNLGTAARAQKFNEAFGLLGITGASAIGKGVGDIKALREDIEKLGGSARKTAEDMDAGLGGSFRKALSAVEGVVLAISGSFGPTLKIATDIVTTATGGITRFVESNRALVEGVALASIGLVGLGTALFTIGVAAKIAASGLGVLITVGTAGAAVVGAAWKTVGLVLAALRLKSTIGAAIIATVWKHSAGLVSSAWSAVVSTLSAAFSAATWTAGATATAAAWVATAGVITVAIFGLDAVMGTTAALATAAWAGSAGTVGSIWTATSGLLATLSVASSGAWVAGAALVSTAWAGVSFVLTALTGPAGILAGLAAIVTAAWTSGAGIVGAAWAAVSASFAASGLAGVTTAGIVSAAWSVLGAVFSVLAIEAGVASIAISTAWTVAATVASLAWGGFTAVLSAALTPAALMAGAGWVVGASWSAAAGIASAAWTVAWAIITAPITPFLAAGAAVVAMVGLISVGLAGLAASLFNWGGAWDAVRGSIERVVGMVKLISVAIMGALSIGEFGLAGKALWAGIRLIFWEGVTMTVKAFQWMFTEAMRLSVVFFSRLASITLNAMKAVAGAIANPFSATKKLTSAIIDLATTPVTFDVSAKAHEAAEELVGILAKIEAAKSKAEKKKEADAIKEGSKTPEEIAAEKRAKIDQLETEGLLTKAEAAKARAAADKEAEDAAKKAADTFADKMRAIELEIVALKEGEDAADRKRLADEGLNDEQIKQIELLKAKKKALEDEKKAQEEASKAAKAAGQERVKDVFDRADEFRKNGASPEMIFKSVMKQIDIDQQAGRIDGEQANDARKRARGGLDGDIGNLRDQGRALAEAMRSPQEKLNAELKKIADLQARGFVDEKTALRAEDNARKQFNDEMKRNEKKADKQLEVVEQEQRRVGPSATFSGFAAAIIAGPGRNLEKEHLRATMAVAKNTKLIAKEAKKDKGGKFR